MFFAATVNMVTVLVTVAAAVVAAERVTAFDVFLLATVVTGILAGVVLP